MNISLPGVRVGACRAHLELARFEVPWDEEASGSVVFEGGRVSQKVDAVRFSLVQHRQGSVHVLATGRDLPGLEVPARMNRHVDFSVPVAPELAYDPLGTLILAEFRTRCTVTVAAQVFVVPPSPYCWVAEVFEETTGFVFYNWEQDEWGAAAAPAAHFFPVGADRRWFTRAIITGGLEGDFFTGRLVVILRQSGVPALLQAISRTNRVHGDLRFRLPDRAAARRQFETHMERLRRPRGPGGRLPIPADAPELDAESLPRPGDAP